MVIIHTCRREKHKYCPWSCCCCCLSMLIQPLPLVSLSPIYTLRRLTFVHYGILLSVRESMFASASIFMLISAIVAFPHIQWLSLTFWMSLDAQKDPTHTICWPILCWETGFNSIVKHITYTFYGNVCIFGMEVCLRACEWVKYSENFSSAPHANAENVLW